MLSKSILCLMHFSLFGEDPKSLTRGCSVIDDLTDDCAELVEDNDE